MDKQKTVISMQLEKTLAAQVKEKAKTLGLSVSTYLRICILNDLRKNDIQNFTIEVK